jgi:hypothetical protein
MISRRAQKRRNLQNKTDKQMTPLTPPSPAPPPARLPQPRVTEQLTYTLVPVFEHGQAGPPEGSRGKYDATFILGIPGIGSTLTELNFNAENLGDSLMIGPGLSVDIDFPDHGASANVVFSSNKRGRLSQVHLALDAESFADAEKFAHDIVMPILSRMSFELNVAVEVTATIMVEKSTMIQSIHAAVVGTAQSVQSVEGPMTPELRPYLSAYREGLNSNSPLYQALSFFKVIEGVKKFHIKRLRASTSNSASNIPDPGSHSIPSSIDQISIDSEWTRICFTPYLGLSFDEVVEKVRQTIRDAVAHISPGMELRTADYYEDDQTCRLIAPVLRYMARVLIQTELDALAGP